MFYFSNLKPTVFLKDSSVFSCRDIPSEVREVCVYE